METALFEAHNCPSLWTCAVVRCVPDLLFLTTYSLLLLFWAQLGRTARGAPCPRLNLMFSLGNGTLYTGFLLIVAMAAGDVLSHGEALQSFFMLLGLSYLVSFLFVLKFAHQFSRMALPYLLRRRVLALSLLCGTVFLVHMIYYLSVGTGLLASWLARSGYPPRPEAYIFDAILYPLQELLPSLAILAVLNRRRGQLPTPLAAAYPYLGAGPYTKIGSGDHAHGSGLGPGSNGLGGGSQSAALASAFYRHNGPRKGDGGGQRSGRQTTHEDRHHQKHFWMNMVVKEGQEARGGSGMMGLMGIYTPHEATTTPSISSESTASAYQAVP